MEIIWNDSNSNLKEYIYKQLETNKDIRNLDIAVSFFKKTGYDEIDPVFKTILSRKGHIRLFTGTYLGITESEAVEEVLDIDNKNFRIFFVKKLNTGYHPKIYRFFGKNTDTVIIGSSNISGGGLCTNMEANVLVDLTNNRYKKLKIQLDIIFEDIRKYALQVDKEVLDEYKNGEKLQKFIMNKAKKIESGIDKLIIEKTGQSKKKGNRGSLPINIDNIEITIEDNYGEYINRRDIFLNRKDNNEKAREIYNELEQRLIKEKDIDIRFGKKASQASCYCKEGKFAALKINKNSILAEIFINGKKPEGINPQEISLRQNGTEASINVPNSHSIKNSIDLIRNSRKLLIESKKNKS